MQRSVKFQVLLFSMAVAVIVANAVWILIDTRPQPFNDNYVEQTFRFVNNLRDASILELPYLIADMRVGPRPPSYQLATVPFVLTLGRSPDNMLIVNGLALIILALCTYKITEMCMNTTAGLLAAVIVLTYPPIVNLAKTARPHAITPAAVALSVMLLLLVYRTRSVQLAWLFGASLGAAFLVHPNTFYALPVPTAVVGLYMVFLQNHALCAEPVSRSFGSIRRRIVDRFVLKGLIPAMMIALVLAAIWYVPAFRGILELIRDSAANWSDVRYGFEHMAPSFWWYARTSPGALSSFFSGLLIVSCAAILLLRSRVEKTSTAIVALFGALIYAGLGLRQGSLAWMNFALALPIVAALTAVGVAALVESISPSVHTSGGSAMGSELKHPRRIHLDKGLTNVIMFLCIGMAGLNYMIVDWGLPRSPAVWQLLGSPLGPTCAERMNVAFCPNPPVGGDWKSTEMLQTVLEDPECQMRECTLVIVANWRDYFSYSHLRYGLAQDFPNARLEVDRVVGHQPSRAWLAADYIVYLRQWNGDSYQDAVIEILESPPERYRGLFQKVKDFPLPNGYTARLVKRTRAISADDAEVLVELLDVPQSVKEQLRRERRSLPDRPPEAAVEARGTPR